MGYLSNRLFKILLALFLLMLGGFIYYAFRADYLIMFDWAEYLGLEEYIINMRNSLSDIMLPYFILYCLPNALWIVSYMLVVDSIVSIDNYKLFWALSLPIIAIIFEILQIFTIILGTFDVLDLVCFIIPSVIYIIYYRYKYKL